ncbi:hypothetical protein AKAW_10534 [Aspergillus luchuensis IFO 4308]|nr:hypothetical protein AKAW_10534 [Aspergillus luchuensis IFO 4308]
MAGKPVSTPARRRPGPTHITEVDKKCSKGVQTLSSVGGSKWGLSLFEKRILYERFVVPQALYASPVWHIPRIHGQMLRHDQQIQTLTAIQRKAGHSIAGGFKAVAGDAFNAELHMMPMKQRLHETRLKTATRIASSNAYAAIVRSRIHSGKPLIRTPLEQAEVALLLQGGIDTQEVKLGLPHVTAPCHMIAETVDGGIPKLYTDGSGHHGEVGAAAVYSDGMPRRSRQAYLVSYWHCKWRRRTPFSGERSKCTLITKARSDAQSMPRSLKEALTEQKHAARTTSFLLKKGRLQYLLPPKPPQAHDTEEG